MIKPSFLLVIVAGEIGVPYVLSSSSELRDKAFSAFTSSHEDEEMPLEAEQRLDGQRPSSQGVEGMPVRNLADIFRFDHTTAWVLGNWPRVSTALAELDLQGYRVALVTGTTEADLAGALTYYFSKEQRIQRIEFRGATGDARPLVSLLVNQHGFVRELTDDPSLFLYRVMDGKDILSELKIKSSSVVRAENPHGRFEISLVMRRPPE